MQKKNKDIGYHAKTNFSLNDKSDFPDLIIGGNKNNAMTENYTDVVETAKSKPATYQKKINELFPTLGDAPAENDNNNKKEEKPVEKKEKAWWEKLNQKNNVEEE